MKHQNRNRPTPFPGRMSYEATKPGFSFLCCTFLLIGECMPSVLWCCWLGSRQGIRPVKKYGGWWRWALFSLDGVAPSRMVSVSASVNLSLHYKVQKFSFGTSSPGWSRKKGRKTVVVVNACFCCVRFCFSIPSQEIISGERLQNDLFCVEWDIKP